MQGLAELQRNRRLLMRLNMTDYCDLIYKTKNTLQATRNQEYMKNKQIHLMLHRIVMKIMLFLKSNILY